MSTSMPSTVGAPSASGTARWPSSAGMRVGLLRAGAVAAFAVTMLTVAWVVLLALTPAPPPEADAAGQLAFVGEHAGWHVAGFAVVVPLALLSVPMWLGLAALLWATRPAIGVLGAAVGLVYVPFGLFGYWSQLTVVRGLVELHAIAPEQAVAAFAVLHFDGTAWSLGYATAVLGYAVWGVAAAIMATGLARGLGSLASWAGAMFALTGVLALIGAVGFVARVEILETGVMVSGVTSLAASATTALLLHRHARRSSAMVSNETASTEASTPRAAATAVNTSDAAHGGAT